MKLTVTQAAARKGVSRTIIMRLITRGTLPAKQVPNRAGRGYCWMIAESDLWRVDGRKAGAPKKPK